MQNKAITVEVKIGDVKFSQPGTVPVYTADDILNLMQSDPAKVEKIFNSSLEASARSAIRNEIVQENGAPERAVLKTAKQLFEARQTLAKTNAKVKLITMAEATAMAKSMLGMDETAA